MNANKIRKLTAASRAEAVHRGRQNNGLFQKLAGRYREPRGGFGLLFGRANAQHMTPRAFIAATLRELEAAPGARHDRRTKRAKG